MASPDNTRPKRPLTQRQLDARRANARRSTGPRTASGKARSAQNARKHGFFAQTALLPHEAPEQFVALRDAYLAEYQPQGPTETHFVMEMANAQWRLRRLRGIEADLLEHITDTQLDSWPPASGQRLAQAYRHLADHSHVLALLHRYEVTLRRQYERALLLFWACRDRRPQPPSPHAELSPAQPLPPAPEPPPSLPEPRPSPALPHGSPDQPPLPQTPAAARPILQNEPKSRRSALFSSTSLQSTRPRPAPPRLAPRPPAAPAPRTTPCLDTAFRLCHTNKR